MDNQQPVVILLVEDDPGHASLIRKNLKRGGFLNEVINVSDGQQALDFIGLAGEFAGRTPEGPLLIILDVNLPRIDGVEVLRRIKADARTAKIPVIILTTTDDPREIERCYEFGCSVYVTKPVIYEKFVDAVRRIGMFLQVVTVLREDEIRRD